ncbi:hypothetical protein K458DRAFT_423363 [Lentithecium fluviatile CBS 122367]|uniref:Uncharacterized protein n=1 Tax=Lentithecium fluviatile CBS 122367 TaxID=1168545 RepID=A0A6G1IJ63_9PLEO|nr:hypothetical protein K458DRAFT_423363 [Lentithecium fluviatile CBS 122367]
MRSTIFTFAALSTLALAKTDYEGCTSSTTVVGGGASVIYWDPTNGEICQYLDCGGGRAPPKTTVPGCAAYEGTATYSPSYLPGWGEMTSSSATEKPTTAAGYPTKETSTGYPVEETSSSTTEIGYPTVTPSSTGYTTLITSAPVLPSASGTGSVYPTGNGTTVESPTLSTSSAPIEQTGAAVAVGVAKGMAGLMAGVFGLAML